MSSPKQFVLDLLPQLPLAPGDVLPLGASPGEIESFQQRTGVPLPTELAQWLASSNGPCFGPGGVYGIRPDLKFLDIESHLSLLPSWCGKDFIPVAGDGCGSQYVVATKPLSGLLPVYFIDHEDNGVLEEPSYIVASGIWRFLWFLFRKELGDKSWPFDSEMVLQNDPELRNFESQVAWRTRSVSE